MPAPDDLEQRALAAVDVEWTLDRLRRLIACPSVTGSAAESQAQALMAQWLEELGMEVDRWSIDLDEARSRPDFPGTEADRDEAWGVVGYLGPASGPTLVLSGHIDVVPPGDRALWSGDPFEPRATPTTVYGRGACDMKAGLVAAVSAVRALSRARIPLTGRVALHSVCSEEDGGLGAWSTMRRGHRGDLAVIPEPTGGAVLTAAAGALTFRLEVPGWSAHGAARDSGISAFEKFWPIHLALRALETERNVDPDPRLVGLALPHALSIGTVHAGDWASTVPDLLVAEGRFGIRIGEDVASARSAFERRIAEVCRSDRWLAEHPVRVSWPGGQFSSGQLPVGHGLLGSVRDAAEAVTGRRPAELAAPYGSDLRHYAAAGIPTVHFGPGDVSHAHAPDERVRIADLLDSARTMALLAVRTCAASESG